MADGTITGFDQAEQVPESQLKPNFAEGFARGFGNATSPQVGGQLQDFFAKHHQQRLAEAQMHTQGIATSGSAIKRIKSGINPETGERFVEGQGESKEDMLARYMAAQQLHRQGLEKLVKATGDKEAHGKLQSVWHMLDHVIHGGGGQQQPQPSAAAASTAPQTPAAQTPPPAGPSAITPQGTATSSGGFPITGAGGPRMTPPPAPPDTTPPKAEGRGPAAAPSTGGQADHTAEDTMRTLPGVRQRMAVDEAIDTTQRAEKAGIKTRQEIADQIPDLKKNSPEYWDFVMFNKPPAGRGALQKASSKLAQEAADLFEEGKPDEAREKLKQVAEVAAAEKGGPKPSKPIEQAQQAYLDAKKTGDQQAIDKAYETMKALATKPGPNNLASWTATLHNPQATPQEKAEAKENIDTWTKVNGEIGAIRMRALAAARAYYQLGTYLDPATHEQMTLDALSASNMVHSGRNVIRIGQISQQQVASVQKFENEAFSDEKHTGAIDETRKYLKAYDNESDKLIFARIMNHIGPPPSGEEVAWVGTVLNQALMDKGLSEDGKKLIPRLARLNETVGSLRASLGAPATNESMRLMQALIPNASVPNAAFANDLLDQFEANSRNSIAIPVMRGVAKTAGERSPETTTTTPRKPGSKQTPPPTGPGKLGDKAKAFLRSQGVPGY